MLVASEKPREDGEGVWIEREGDEGEKGERKRRRRGES